MRAKEKGRVTERERKRNYKSDKENEREREREREREERDRWGNGQKKNEIIHVTLANIRCI